MSGVIVIGSSNLDLTIKVDRLPSPGETVFGREVYESFGGKGANQAAAAMKAGADVTFLTKLGRDTAGERIAAQLGNMGFPPEGLLRDASTATGRAFILVDQAGGNQIVVVPGSNMTLTPDDVRRASARIRDAQVLLLQLEVPLETVVEALREAKQYGVTTILNPAPAQALPDEILTTVDVLTPNEGEAGTLTGSADHATAAALLMERGPQYIVVTLGEHGAYLRHRGGDRTFPAFPVQAIDSTAAGDAFSGALACALAEREPIEQAIEFANAAGALATTTRGAQESLPSRAEIEALLQPSDRAG